MLNVLLGSLSTHVFETRTATGSELFSLLTCPHTTTFTLLSIVSPLEMNSIKIWKAIRSKNANCSLPVAVRVSKTCVLQLPITNSTQGQPGAAQHWNEGKSRARTGNYSASKMAARSSKKMDRDMDKTLDFLSPKFDPLKALYTTGIQPPVPNIQIFNNVAEYALTIKEGKTRSSEVVKLRNYTDSSRRPVSRTKNLKPEYKPVQKEVQEVQERLKAIAESKTGNTEDTKLEKKSDVRMDDTKLQEFILAEEAFKADQKRKKRMDVIQRMHGKSLQY